MKKNIVNKDRLIFALDIDDCKKAQSLVEELGDSVSFYKLGLELMMTDEYFDLMSWLLKNCLLRRCLPLSLKYLRLWLIKV